MSDPTPDPKQMSALRARLRAGDPVAADPVGEERDWNQIRPRIAARLAMAEREGAPRRVALLAFAAPALALGALVAVAWLGVRFAARPHAAQPVELVPGERSAAVPSSAAEAGGSTSSSGGDESGSRQIQFETAGGTRVIWVLDPRFNL